MTSDGTTLLGADDKAGVAEIMAAAAYLVRHPEIEHGRIRVLFNPDEEVGRGTDHLDLEAFGADVAYTLDGSDRGEIEAETFSAVKATVVFHGRSAHSGTAKGVLVNAVKAAGDFLSASPARGSRRKPPTAARGSSIRTRSWATSRRQRSSSSCATSTRRCSTSTAIWCAGSPARLRSAAEPRSRSTLEREYSNMSHFIDDPWIVEAAEEAIRRAGSEPRRSIIRGGTDGSRLSEKGLPCPNLSTGGHDYHSRREWLCVPDMGAAAATIIHLAQVWSIQDLVIEA